MEYLKAFVAGGFLCLIGQILIDKTKLTPARILVAYVVAGVVLVQFPDLSLPAVCGIGSMLGIAGYQVIEIAIQRRFKGRGKP